MSAAATKTPTPLSSDHTGLPGHPWPLAWYSRRDLNPRPAACKADALPAELHEYGCLTGSAWPRFSGTSARRPGGILGGGRTSHHYRSGAVPHRCRVKRGVRSGMVCVPQGCRLVSVGVSVAALDQGDVAVVDPLNDACAGGDVE